MSMALMQRLRGVLGINRRNLDLVMRENPFACRRVVDDKVATKQVLRGEGIAVAPDIAVVRDRADIAGGVKAIREAGSAVVKPAHGLGGNGLMIVRDEKERQKDEAEIAFHLAAICAGAFSGGEEDQALIEPLLCDRPALADIHGGHGLADLRIVVQGQKPLMAMLRLPCAASRGAANLHAGGLGVGVDLSRGVTTRGLHRGRTVERHPDTDRELANYQLPQWPLCLAIAGRMSQIFGLGYLGIDLVVDAERGLLVLEVNARPGLAVQVANAAGLRRSIALAAGV